MDEGIIIEQGDQLSEDLRVERQQAQPNQWRCSDELRSRIVGYAVACRADGESHQSIAFRLGLIQPTLSRWIREARKRGGSVRQVAIVPSAADRATEPAPSPPLRLLTPRGFVVEGLEPEQLAYLLRVIG